MLRLFSEMIFQHWVGYGFGFLGSNHWFGLHCSCDCVYEGHYFALGEKIYLRNERVIPTVQHLHIVLSNA